MSFAFVALLAQGEETARQVFAQPEEVVTRVRRYHLVYNVSRAIIAFREGARDLGREFGLTPHIASEARRPFAAPG